jgi:hypothetical protein
MRSSLSGGLEWVFVILAIDAAVVALVAIRLMPTVHIERRGVAPGVAPRVAPAVAPAVAAPETPLPPRRAE